MVAVQLGSRYEITVGLLKILWIVGLTFSIVSPAGALLLACGRADIGFYVNVTRTVLIMGGVWIGSHWGLHGIAWSIVVVVVVVMFPIPAYIRWMLFGMGWGEFLSRLWPFAAAAAVASAACVAAHRWIPWPSDLIELGMMAPLAGSIYFALLWWRARPRIERIIRLVRS
jgi:O-antigen/teichoic acid export membrane protein